MTKWHEWSPSSFIVFFAETMRATMHQSSIFVGCKILWSVSSFSSSSSSFCPHGPSSNTGRGRCRCRAPPYQSCLLHWFTLPDTGHDLCGCHPARATFSVGSLLPLIHPPTLVMIGADVACHLLRRSMVAPDPLLKLHGHCQLLSFIPIIHLLTLVASDANVRCRPARAAFSDGPPLPPTIPLPPCTVLVSTHIAWLVRIHFFVAKFSRKKLNHFDLCKKKL